MIGQLGSIGTIALDGALRPTGPDLRVVPATSSVTRRFPAGAQTRTVDDDGRIKFGSFSGRGLVDLLGWRSGGLDAVIVDGWLVLTQTESSAAARPDRNGNRARFSASVSGIERVALRPAHLRQLGLPDDRNLLVAPIPGSAALVIVDPAVCLAGPAGHVTSLLDA